LGREILPGRVYYTAERICFNPLPAFGPGDTLLLLLLILIMIVSIRSRLLGREIRYACLHFIFNNGVSIRSRLLGREILAVTIRMPHGGLFQSAPGFWAGRYVIDYVASCKLYLFQSAPGFWAGRYELPPPPDPPPPGFNPLPAFGPGDTADRSRDSHQDQVSIRSRLLGREIL